MTKYWSFGNNTNFLLLLSWISHAELCRTTIRSGDDTSELESARNFLQPAHDFFQSLEDEVANIWSVVCAPFSRASTREIQDFIAGEDEEVVEACEDEPNPFSHSAMRMEAELADFGRERSADEMLVARYESIARAQQGSYSEDDQDNEADEPDHDDGGESEDSTDTELSHNELVRYLTPTKRANGNEHSRQSLSVATKVRKRLVIDDSD